MPALSVGRQAHGDGIVLLTVPDPLSRRASASASAVPGKPSLQKNMKDLRKNRKVLSDLCRLASLAGLAAGVGWLAIFMFADQWLMATLMLLLGMAILPCWLAARSGHFALGLKGAQVICIPFTIVFALVFDIPSDSAPRTTHLFLLVIALVGYVNLQLEHSKAQLAILAAALLAFLALCSISLAFPVAAPPSHEFRVGRAWVNATLVTALLCCGIVAMHAELINAMRSAVELRAALDNRQFELFYQPQVDVEGRLLGAEALLRWRHPKRGYVSPAEFIPVAECSGVMPSLGNWVVREACQTLALWQDRPLTRELTLSINITAEQFALPGFVDQLLIATAQHNIQPASLKLELTESAFLVDIDSVIAKMHVLQTAGFAISLDDFGTGYSSLSHLRRLPLSQLKIDRSFVRGVDNNPRAAAIVRNIVQMGHDLSLDVLAEGVETEAQLHAMRSCGCSTFQGFWFARPMCLGDFEHYAAGCTTRGAVRAYPSEASLSVSPRLEG